MEQARIYEGDGLKYLHQKVMALLQTMSAYRARLCGSYVRDVVLKIRDYDFSPTQVDHVAFCFLRQEHINCFTRSLPRTLKPIKGSPYFSLVDDYGDFLCRVYLSTKANFTPIFRLGWLYCDRYEQLYTSSRWCLSDVFDDIRQKRAVFTNLNPERDFADMEVIETLVAHDWRLYRLTPTQQLEEIWVQRRANNFIIYGKV